VFCEGVQHRVRFCLDHLSCIKMTVLQFYLQSGKRNSWMAGGRQSCCFGNKFRGGRCETVRFRDVTASSFVAKVPGEVFVHLPAVSVKRYSNMRN
jgi:hypothetical protein